MQEPFIGDTCTQGPETDGRGLRLPIAVYPAAYCVAIDAQEVRHFLHADSAHTKRFPQAVCYIKLRRVVQILLIHATSIAPHGHLRNDLCTRSRRGVLQRVVQGATM